MQTGSKGAPEKKWRVTLTVDLEFEIEASDEFLAMARAEEWPNLDRGPQNGTIVEVQATGVERVK